MLTKIVKINLDNKEETVRDAGEIIKNGGIVIFPTETVYGIGANALDEKSSEKIYAAKSRPSDNPLIVHIQDIKEIDALVKKIDERTRKIIDKFWPGPLTIIVEKSEIVPYKTTGGLDTVAIRMPSNEIARDIIKQSNLPVAAPSANISGKPSITSEEYMKDEFDGKVDMIILDNDTAIGIESTVIDTTTENITILRPGFITKTDIENVIGEEVLIDMNLKDAKSAPKSPGMKYKHYSPNCEIIIVDGNEQQIIEKIEENMSMDRIYSLKSAVIAKEIYKDKFENFISLGATDVDIAKNLFKTLRDLDRKKINKAYFINLKDSELAFSIMDRVKKAAAYKII